MEAGKLLLARPCVTRRSNRISFWLLGTIATAFFSYYYVKYGRIIDARFKGQVFSNSAKIYAIPQTVRVGEKIDAREIAAQLRAAGYTNEDGSSPIGSYRLLASRNRN